MARLLRWSGQTSLLPECTLNPAELDDPTALSAATARRFVRVLQRGPGDLVRFEFAIGWPDLCAELVLPSAAFDAFCARENTLPWPADHGAEPRATP